MKIRKKSSVFGFVVLGIACLSVNLVGARQILHLSLDKSVETVMKKSYRVKQLQMGIERSRFRVKARQASLKSRVL